MGLVIWYNCTETQSAEVYICHTHCPLQQQIGMDVGRVQETGLPLPLYKTVVQMFSK